jgi:hypothetical protein
MLNMTNCTGKSNTTAQPVPHWGKPPWIIFSSSTSVWCLYASLPSGTFVCRPVYRQHITCNIGRSAIGITNAASHENFSARPKNAEQWYVWRPKTEFSLRWTKAINAYDPGAKHGQNGAKEDYMRLPNRSARTRFIGRAPDHVMHSSHDSPTYLVNLVACCAGQIPFLSEPVALDLHLESALDHRVARKLGEWALRQLVDLTDPSEKMDQPVSVSGTASSYFRLTCVATLYSSSSGSYGK